jgi:hypothetical protein
MKKWLSGVFTRLKTLPFYVYLFAASFLIIILVGVAYLYPSLLPDSLKRLVDPFPQQGENIAEPPRLSSIPIAAGRQVYNISGGKTGAPRMIQAIVDPLDIEGNELQSFMVNAFDEESEIVGITAAVITDNGQNEYPLSLTDGTRSQGTWSGSWRITDTFLYNYQIMLTAVNQNGVESTVTMTFR